ncbi:MAG TPA: ABC transporter permease [Thermodesulfobacteriota bacterium]|nr:ABC transporter permease [Thermodesulfobacteriota bacterium]
MEAQIRLSTEQELHRSQKSRGYWGTVWAEFKKDKLAVAGLIVILFLCGIAVFDDFLAGNKPIILRWNGEIYFPALFRYPELVDVNFEELSGELKEGDFAISPPISYSATEYDLLSVLSPPSEDHLLGTDDRGRDVLSRMIHGTRISLSIGFVAVGIAVVIGILMGALAGYYGGTVDFIISRLFEVMMTFPVFFLILTILAFRNPSIYNIMIVIGATGWTGIARLIRGEFLKLRKYDYVEAAVALGSRDSRIMLKHMLPNAIAPVLVAATFGVAGAILVESALSFLGFGVPPPQPSWGEVLSQSQRYVDFAWWLVLFPGAAIFVTVTAFNLVGEGFRDAIDPKLRGRKL